MAAVGRRIAPWGPLASDGRIWEPAEDRLLAGEVMGVGRLCLFMRGRAGSLWSKVLCSAARAEYGVRSLIARHEPKISIKVLRWNRLPGFFCWTYRRAFGVEMIPPEVVSIRRT